MGKLFTSAFRWRRGPSGRAEVAAWDADWRAGGANERGQPQPPTSEEAKADQQAGNTSMLQPQMFGFGGIAS